MSRKVDSVCLTRRDALCGVALALSGGARAAGVAPEDLVLVRAGKLPILLTAPHGGRLDIPGVRRRTAPDAAHAEAFARWGGFKADGDTNTDTLALRIAAEIQALTGRAPSLVLAKFRRRFIDANRPAELAYADEAAAPYYARYHRSIRAIVDDIRRDYPAGVLLDVHGQNKDPDVLMRGTSNGDSVAALVRRAGVRSITGGEGLFGQLETQGVKVFPSNRQPLWGRSENAGFNGGYTSNTYGSLHADGIDAVQLEFGTRYRLDAEVEKTAGQVARAIVVFYRAYVETATKERR